MLLRSRQEFLWVLCQSPSPGSLSQSNRRDPQSAVLWKQMVLAVKLRIVYFTLELWTRSKVPQRKMCSLRGAAVQGDSAGSRETFSAFGRSSETRERAVYPVVGTPAWLLKDQLRWDETFLSLCFTELRVSAPNPRVPPRWILASAGAGTQRLESTLWERETNSSCSWLGAVFLERSSLRGSLLQNTTIVLNNCCSIGCT